MLATTRHTRRTNESETSENEYKETPSVSEMHAALTLQRQGTHVERTSGQPLQGSGERW
jgi:hypothetical protein